MYAGGWFPLANQWYVTRLMIFIHMDVALILFMESVSLDLVRIFLFEAYVAVTNGYPYMSSPSAWPCTYMGDLYLARSMSHDALIYGAGTMDKILGLWNDVFAYGDYIFNN